eukprot:scaffold3827_cov179-Cylindrotheca_fusiformis.AAC.12
MQGTCLQLTVSTVDEERRRRGLVAQPPLHDGMNDHPFVASTEICSSTKSGEKSTHWRRKRDDSRTSIYFNRPQRKGAWHYSETLLETSSTRRYHNIRSSVQ